MKMKVEKRNTLNMILSGMEVIKLQEALPS